ncbi:hypothetical protein FRC12_008967, partial [Ceratobasidium sp. 428]
PSIPIVTPQMAALLQKALKHRAAHDFPTDRHAQQLDLASLNSTDSFASSIGSFYSSLTGGSKVPKRRRSPVSTLGQAQLTAGTRELQRVGTRADGSGRLLSQIRTGRSGGSAWAVQMTTARVGSMRTTCAGRIRMTCG